EFAALLERLHQPLLEAEVFQATTLRKRKRQRLLIVVTQHQARNLVGHFREERITPVHRERAGPYRSAERDLDIYLEVRGIHAGGIVDRVGIEPDPALRRLDAAALRHAEIGAFTDHLAVELATRDANRIVCTIASRLVAFIRSPDISTDASEEKKVDLCAKDRFHQLLRR